MGLETYFKDSIPVKINMCPNPYEQNKWYRKVMPPV